MSLKTNKENNYKFFIKKPKIINITNKDYDYITAFIIYCYNPKIKNKTRLYTKEKLELLDNTKLQTIVKINKLSSNGTNSEIIERILNKFNNTNKQKLFSLNLLLENKEIPYILKDIGEKEIYSMINTKIDKINLLYNRNKIKVYMINVNYTNVNYTNVNLNYIKFNNSILNIQTKYFLYDSLLDESIINKIIMNSFNKHLHTKIKNKYLNIKYKTIINYLF